MNNGNVGFLPAISAGTLFVFYLVWAAMHDIAHANESGYTLEYFALVASIPMFAFLYRTALRLLTARARLAWLIGTGLLITLFDAAAVAAKLQPKYANDPMLASAFLAVTLPVLGLIGCHLVREARHPGVHAGR